jgi:hypothetical protein
MVQARPPSKMMPPPIYRGIIIVDTSALIDMEHRVGSNLKNNGAGIERYLDILPFLAAHGYKVLIPEMVAYETTTTLSGGKNVSRYFPRPAKPDWFTHADLTAFFEKVQKGQWPNIAITPTIEPPEVVKFLQALHRIVDAHPTPSFDAATLLAGAQKGAKADFGDKAIAHLLQKFASPMKRVGVPVFFLSTDRHAMKALSSECPDAGMLTVNGMVDGMLRNRLHAPLGLKPQCSTANIIDDIATQTRLTSSGTQGAHTAIIDLGGRKYAEWANRPGFDSCIKDKPFMGSVSKVANELVAPLPKGPPPMNTMEDDEATRPGNRQARFSDKFTKDPATGKWTARNDRQKDERRKGNGRAPGH